MVDQGEGNSLCIVQPCSGQNSPVQGELLTADFVNLAGIKRCVRETRGRTLRFPFVASGQVLLQPGWLHQHWPPDRCSGVDALDSQDVLDTQQHTSVVKSC